MVLRMSVAQQRTSFLSLALALAMCGPLGCSGGGEVTDEPDGGRAPSDLATVSDLAVPAADLATAPLPLSPCSYRDRFVEVYGHAYSDADVAFVTADGKVARGLSQLDLPAQKSQVPDIVHVKGNANLVKQIQLLSPGGSTVLATRSGAYVYGLGYAMWLEINGYGEAGITQATLLRQLTLEEPTYPQLVGLFRVLTRTAEGQVAAADLADFQQAAAKLLAAIESGRLTFQIGTGHAADFPATAQVVNGKSFSFQLSAAYGLDPQLGFQRNGVWGPKWQSYGPTGGWSANAPGLQPKCGGCTVDHYAGATYQVCDGPLDRSRAAAACRVHGGYLATANDLFTGSFLRGLAPNVSGALIGLNDQQQSGQYQWDSGQPASYFNWAPGQPDNFMNQEHCVQLVDGKTSTQWNDISCGQALPYLCQLP
jgi:hypothetical protein